MVSQVEASVRRHAPGPVNGLLTRVLARQHIYVVYQPIVHLPDRTTVGYEALARPVVDGGEGAETVEEFFGAAQRLGVIRDIDWLCRRAAVAGAQDLDDGVFLSLNVNSDLLSEPWLDVEVLLQVLEAEGRVPADTVLEIQAPDRPSGVDKLFEACQVYRDAGLRIALSGVNEGSSFALLPGPFDFIKLSRSVAAHLYERDVQAFISAAMDFAAREKVRLVVEGIEAEDVVTWLVAHNVELGQGYYLGMPAPLEGANAR